MTLDEVQRVAEAMLEDDSLVVQHRGHMMHALIDIARGAHETLEIAHRIDSPASKLIRNHLSIPFRNLDRIKP